MVSQAVRLSSFVVIPMLLGLFAVADTLVLALLGEQWMVCVPFLRIMCISYCFWPVHIANLQAINELSTVFPETGDHQEGLKPCGPGSGNAV